MKMFLSIVIDSVRSFSEDLINNLPVRDALSVIVQHYSQREILQTAQLSDLFSMIREISKASGKSLVLVFDNLDLLPPEDVVYVATIARAIFFSTQQAVVLALRPSTDTIRMEYSRDKAAFFPFIINLVPPTLFLVLKSRLRVTLSKLSRDKSSFALSGRIISIADVESRIVTMFGNVMGAFTQELLIRKLCNNDVRRSLQAFRDYIRNRDFPISLLIENRIRNDAPQRLNTPRFSQFINGIMVGSRYLYTEAGNTIMNIYLFTHPTLPSNDHYVQYFVMCFFSTSGGQVKTSRLVQDASSLGLGAATINRCVQRLVSYGLLTSPESGQGSVRHASISETGRYYIEHLCVNEDYLLNVVHDVDVTFRSVSLQDAQRFHDRLAAVCDLVRLVSSEESRLLSRFSKEKGNGIKALFALATVGCLAKRILDAVDKVSRKMPNWEADQKQSFVDKSARLVRRVGADVRHSVNANCSLLDSIRVRVLEGDVSEVLTIDSFVPSLGRIEIVAPAVISSIADNNISVRFEPSFDLKSDHIVALWSCVEHDVFFRHFLQLRRGSGETVFKGSFNLEHDAEDLPFPARSDIRMFDETRTLGALQLAA